MANADVSNYFSTEFSNIPPLILYVYQAIAPKSEAPLEIMGDTTIAGITAPRWQGINKAGAVGPAFSTLLLISVDPLEILHLDLRDY